MRGRRELIRLASGQSFRLLRWQHNLRDMDSLLAGGRIVRVEGEGTRWHYHPEMELTQFIAGEGTLFVGDHVAPLSPGEAVLLGERLPHHWHVQGASSGLSLQWAFPEGHPFWSFPESLSLVPLFQAASRGIAYGGDRAADIRRALLAMVGADAPERLGLLLGLLGRLAGTPERERVFLSTRSFSLPALARHQQAMSHAVRYLLANFRQTIRLGEVLRLVHLSKPTFARLFREHSGKCFTEFLTEVRLQAACRGLAQTDRPVLDVALTSGFSQVSFFNRVFRRRLRCTPREFRARHRKPKA